MIFTTITVVSFTLKKNIVIVFDLGLFYVISLAFLYGLPKEMNNEHEQKLFSVTL